MNQAGTIHETSVLCVATAPQPRRLLNVPSAAAALWCLAGLLVSFLLAGSDTQTGAIELYGVWMPAAAWLGLLLYRGVSKGEAETSGGYRRRRAANRGSAVSTLPSGMLRARRGRGNGTQRRPHSAPG